MSVDPDGEDFDLVKGELGSEKSYTPSSHPTGDIPPENKDENVQVDPDLQNPAAPPKAAKFIRRSDWGAKPPKWIKALEVPVKKVVLTWTETDPCHTEEECIKAVQRLQEEHMKDPECPDIKHNFLVGGDGALYEGRGYTREGPFYPPSEKNNEGLTGKSIEIAFIQRHGMVVDEVMGKVVPDCCSTGIVHNVIERNFEFYYITGGEIIKKQRTRAKDVYIKKEK